MLYRMSFLLFSMVLVIASLFTSASTAQSPRVFPEGKVPADKRLGPLKTLNGHFPFKVPDTAGGWYDRATRLKQRVLVANGLLPMPERTPLNPVIHGKVQRDGFTVEKVYFQSLPGHYVTGLLFRPDAETEKPRPGVLSPHGHGGRQMVHSPEQMKRFIASGAEHYAASGSMPKLARCAQLAKMGCVTFIFDMLGYADSLQIDRATAHRHKNPREEERTNEDGWVFYSPQADLRLQSIMGLQTWNAIRSLDFLESLPDVDPTRLAVTGGSGGGTQSILLGAIDDRIKVSFPNGMVSTSMQGGCYCENCSYLRVGTGNVELAALFAPRPQAMTAADDWTKDMMKDGYPELQWLYAMIGNEEDVYCRPMLHFKHNYNYVTRATMYHWMNKHLNLGLDVPVIETDFVPLTDAETKVWDKKHPAPLVVGPDHERSVCRWLDQQSKTLSDMKVETKDDAVKFLGLMMAAWQVLLDVPTQQQIEFESLSTSSLNGLSITKGVLREQIRGAELPLLKVTSPSSAPDKLIIWTDGQGKRVAFDSDGKPTETLNKLAKSATVLLPDLLGQGEFNKGDEPVAKQRLNDERSYCGFTYGYNRTLFADRVGDLLAVIKHASGKDKDVRLIASGGSAPWAAGAASACSKDQLSKMLIDTNSFRFANAQSYADSIFVPGAVKYGDLPTLLAFCVSKLRVVGESDLSRTKEIRQHMSVKHIEIADKKLQSDENIEWIIE